MFQYLDEEGNRHTIDSADVNDYLREISGEEITAKDFRTWAATNLAALALQEFELFDTEAKKKRAVVRAVENVAKHLGNTPAICRRCYIHPAIFDGYLDGTLLTTLKEQTQTYLAENVIGMSAEEAAVVAFLRLRLGELEKEQKESGSSSGNGQERRSSRSPRCGSGPIIGIVAQPVELIAFCVVRLADADAPLGCARHTRRNRWRGSGSRSSASEIAPPLSSRGSNSIAARPGILPIPGVMHLELGGYHIGDIEFVAAFDIAVGKVGCDLAQAILRPSEQYRAVFERLRHRGGGTARPDL